MPSTYILDNERGLNACAAGNGTSDAIVVVTRDLLDNLSRDELQGVIGHEFSHILNGDMALNMRMRGLLSGIVAIGSLGSFLLRNSVFDHHMDGSKSRDAFLPSLVAGLVMVTVGYSGLLFARLIKAAVLRKREYLADASSVQFTRNPEGLVSALEKMRTSPAGTWIQSRYAEEASHMFIGQSFQPWLSGLCATHPPLEKRIRRITPDFSPLLYQARKRIAARGAGARAQPQSQTQSNTQPQTTSPRVNIPGMSGAANNVKAARRHIDSLPPYLYQKTTIPRTACEIVLALILSPNDEVRRAQLAVVKAAGMKSLAETSAALEQQTRQVAADMRFPLIELALRSIKGADKELRDGFLKALGAVINADRRISPHEFVELTLMSFQVGNIPANHAVKFQSLEEVREDALWLLSLVAYAGCGATSEAEQKELETAFAAGLHQMKLGNATHAAHSTFNQQTAVAALGKLRQLAPLEKSRPTQGLLACTMANGTMRVIEAELMRMVCAVLDCPLPLLFDRAAGFGNGQLTRYATVPISICLIRQSGAQRDVL